MVGGWLAKQITYTLYVGVGGSPKVYIYAKSERAFQKSALHFVRTSWKTSLGNISPFLSNVFFQFTLKSLKTLRFSDDLRGGGGGLKGKKRGKGANSNIK